MFMEKIKSNDILMAILVRLPPKPVFRFRCVSKRWNNIVTNPFFIQSYEDRKREEQQILSKDPLAFIQSRTYAIVWRNWNFNSSDSTTKLLPLNQTEDGKIIKIPNKFSYFIHSSNGLILCGKHHNVYYILNPLARTYVYLPLPPRVRGYVSMGLVCEENTRDLVPNYKVVQACIPPFRDFMVQSPKRLSIQTYSSKTREWKSSTLLGTGKFSIDPSQPPMVFNGVFHWFTWKESLAVYDSNGCDNHMQLIILPHDVDIINSTSVSRSSSDDVLWFGVNQKYQCSQFWKLPKDQNGGYKRSTTIRATEWILMCTITQDSLCRDIVMAQQVHNKRRKIYDNVHGAVDDDDDYKESGFGGLKCMIPGNPHVAVLRFRGKFCFYNLETESVESVIYDEHHIRDLESIDNWYPYMEPLSLALYPLSAGASY